MNKKDLTIWVLFLALVAIILAGVLWCVNNRLEEIDKAGDVEVVIPTMHDGKDYEWYKVPEIGMKMYIPGGIAEDLVYDVENDVISGKKITKVLFTTNDLLGKYPETCSASKGPIGNIVKIHSDTLLKPYRCLDERLNDSVIIQEDEFYICKSGSSFQCAVDDAGIINTKDSEQYQDTIASIVWGSIIEVAIPEKPIQIADTLNIEDIDTSNWKTYRNEEYGFELRYPEDWKVEYDIDTWISSMDGVGGVSIKLEKDLVVEDYIVHYNNSDISNGMSLSKILTVENVDINGKEAVVLMGSTSIGINNLITVIANGDDLYTLTYKDVQQYHAENSAIVESFIISR